MSETVYPPTQASVDWAQQHARDNHGHSAIPGLCETCGARVEDATDKVATPLPSESHGHIADQAATGDGRVIAWAILSLADEVRMLTDEIRRGVR